MYSCGKEPLNVNNSLTTTQQFNLNSYRQFNQTEEILLNYNQGAEDYEMRKIQLVFHKALLDVLKNKEYVKLIVDDAKQSPLKQAQLTRVAGLDRNFKTDLNSALANHYYETANRITEDDLLEYLESLLIYEGDDYLAVIIIPNLDSLNIDYPPIISGGLELDESLDSSLDDDIYATQYDADFYTTDIILNEKEGTSSLQPVIVFANGIDDTEYEGKAVFGDGFHTVQTDDNLYENAAKTNLYTQHFSLMYISIKSEDYFYEPLTSGTKNNFAFTGVYFTSSNVWGWLFNENPSDISKLVRKFTKDECDGTKLLYWDEVWNVDEHWPQPTSAILAYFNTFERDWASSAKDLGHYTYLGETAYLTGKRKHTNEWYISDPYTEGGLVLNGSVVTLWEYLNVYKYKSDYCITRSE